MPDPMTILVAMAGSAGLALLILAIAGRLGSRLASAGGAVGVYVGLIAGAVLLGQTPHWPPREDLDRLLVIVLPAVVLAELIAAFLPRLGWLARLIVAAGTARVLLQGSSYITDLAGPGTREWDDTRTAMILGGIAAGMFVVWWLADRQITRGTSAVVALTCAGAGAVVLLSGYSTAGQLGIVLAATMLAACVTPSAGAEGVGIVGFCGLLIVGRFFGSLSTANALLVLAAIPAASVAGLLRVGPTGRACAALALGAIPIATAVTRAALAFAANVNPYGQ
ncbi:MAG: hypothetical protein K1X57_10795 [Gemmataceae bacterium]|nr:hypothetical protein [Gemmataceae bacterium]